MEKRLTGKINEMGDAYYIGMKMLVCEHGLKEFYNLPRPLPEEITLVFSDTESKGAYLARLNAQNECVTYSDDRALAADVIDTSTAMWPIDEALRSFPSRGAWVSLEY